MPAQNPVNGQVFYEAFLVVWSSLPAMLAPGTQEQPFRAVYAREGDYARKLPPDALPKAWAVFKDTEAQVDAFMANYDAWLTPVLALPPVRLGELAPTLDLKTLTERRMHYVVYTQIHNVAGTPAMSAPLGMSEGDFPSAVSLPLPRDARICSTPSPMSWKPRNPGRRAHRKSA